MQVPVLEGGRRFKKGGTRHLSGLMKKTEGKEGKDKRKHQKKHDLKKTRMTGNDATSLGKTVREGRRSGWGEKKNTQGLPKAFLRSLGDPHR